MSDFKTKANFNRENRLSQTMKKEVMFARFRFEILHSFPKDTDVCWHLTILILKFKLLFDDKTIYL